jgi:transposase
MLRMDRVHVIRHKVLVEGQSARRVARELGIARKTVARYLRESEPKRVEKAPRPRPVSGWVGLAIEAVLEAWRGRTTAKQRVTASRVHRELREQGHMVGTTTVKAYMAERRRRAAEVFVPLVYRAGDLAEVDFFEVTVEVRGELMKAWKFLMRLMASGKDFAYVYERCDQVSFLDGHVRAFEAFGGVPRRSAYDNLTAAVKRRVGGLRVLTERFLALVSHYTFEACFARVGEGHDKGGVEGRGRGIRLQHFVPVPRGESLAAISEGLREDLERQAERRTGSDPSVAERFARERVCLGPLPGTSFDARQKLFVEASSRALVKVDGAEYSVPEEWARRSVLALVGPSEVTITWQGEETVHPRRRRGRHVRYVHYLRQLSRKPQALRQVAPELLAELGAPFDLLWQRLVDERGELDAARVMAVVLRAVVDRGLESVRRAVGVAVVGERMDLLALGVGATVPAMPCVIVPAALAAIEVESGLAATYDRLLGTGWLQ